MINHRDPTTHACFSQHPTKTGSQSWNQKIRTWKPWWRYCSVSCVNMECSHRRYVQQKVHWYQKQETAALWVILVTVTKHHHWKTRPGQSSAELKRILIQTKEKAGHRKTPATKKGRRIPATANALDLHHGRFGSNVRQWSRWVDCTYSVYDFMIPMLYVGQSAG